MYRVEYEQKSRKIILVSAHKKPSTIQTLTFHISQIQDKDMIIARQNNRIFSKRTE